MVFDNATLGNIVAVRPSTAQSDKDADSYYVLVRTFT
jgi:hypothetical protein